MLVIYMPVGKGTSTSSVVQNIRALVRSYNHSCHDYVRDYSLFMKERAHLLTANNGNFARLLNDSRFSDQLQDILTKFGMDARSSKLVSPQRFLDTVGKVGAEFQYLNTSQVRLHTLKLRQTATSQTVCSIVGEIYNHFEAPDNLSEAGGFVVASKTMHFILPELFIMLDGKHIGISLYNISDFHPHPDDGTGWFDAVPDYSGRKPNPSPRGEGRRLWDFERYCIALMYYKRIVREWCQQNNSNIEGFLNLDAEYANTAARIIDKALW